MKKLISLALALVLSLSLIACGAKQDDTPQTGADTPDTTQTAEKQKLIVGFDAEFPPFGFIAADGSYDGFDLAMAEELCSRLGWDFEAVPIVWDSKDAELAAGTINCIWNGFTYTGRENDYTWSDPYVDNSIVMVVKADQRHFLPRRPCRQERDGAGRLLCRGRYQRQRVAQVLPQGGRGAGGL